jgi:hypothetical protein
MMYQYRGQHDRLPVDVAIAIGVIAIILLTSAYASGFLTFAITLIKLTI